MAENAYKIAYGVHPNETTPTGNPTRKTYGYTIDKWGRKKLESTGEEDTQEKIQSYYEDTKIENMLAKAANGDTTVFRPNGMYGDMTIMPTNLIEAMEMTHRLEDLWDNLPKETKKKYKNIEEFVTASGTEEWAEDVGMKEKAAPTPEIKTKTTTEGEITE